MPWYNFKGLQVAASVADLHSDANNLTKDTALTEKGAPVNGRGDTPNMHDILTGTAPDGTLSATTTGTGDTTCSPRGMICTSLPSSMANSMVRTVIGEPSPAMRPGASHASAPSRGQSAWTAAVASARVVDTVTV